MKKSCQKFDQDLLMSVHGELGGWQNLRLQIHVIGCPACRARQKQLGALTQTLAIAFRNPSLGTRSFAHANPARWGSLGLVAVLLSMLGWLVASNIATAAASASAPAYDPNVPHHCPLEMAASEELPAKPKAAPVKPPVPVSPPSPKANVKDSIDNIKPSNLPVHHCD